MLLIGRTEMFNSASFWMSCNFAQSATSVLFSTFVVSDLPCTKRLQMRTDACAPKNFVPVTAFALSLIACLIGGALVFGVTFFWTRGKAAPSLTPAAPSAPLLMGASSSSTSAYTAPDASGPAASEPQSGLALPLSAGVEQIETQLSVELGQYFRFHRFLFALNGALSVLGLISVIAVQSNSPRTTADAMQFMYGSCFLFTLSSFLLSFDCADEG
jgi:hypothetical protein